MSKLRPAASAPQLHIICDDAISWLSSQQQLPNIVTGICDMDEMKGVGSTSSTSSADQYLNFFSTVADLIFSKLGNGCYAIFIQTDRKHQRSWIDKSYILTDIARQHQLKTVWHKIVLHRNVDATDLHRPTYAHMLCFSRDGTTGAATPDVIPPSKRLYKNATPPEAARRALEFVKRYSKVKTVVDPFVGQGTIISIARDLGLNAVGIDIDQRVFFDDRDRRSIVK